MKTNSTLAKILLPLACLAAAGLNTRAAEPAVANADVLPLPTVYFRDSKAYAYAWDGKAWQILPRNEARIFDGKGHDGMRSNRKKQLTGTLLLDGCYQVPAVNGENVILAFRAIKDFKTYKGLPEGETGFEVTRLECKDGVKPGTLVRTARLQRLGEAAATFGEKREPIVVQKIKNHEGVFHVVYVTVPLPAGRYALYLPDRAFEFEVK